ncbi:hypothetical protein ACJA23_01790 [Mycoplasma corogypsi]|uniref:hypothetical protein n=1 Tax=Mycoplasma corogypsi TaxID=2106 RepID=UPI00387379E6
MIKNYNKDDVLMLTKLALKPDLQEVNDQIVAINKHNNTIRRLASKINDKITYTGYFLHFNYLLSGYKNVVFENENIDNTNVLLNAQLLRKFVSHLLIDKVDSTKYCALFANKSDEALIKIIKNYKYIIENLKQASEFITLFEIIYSKLTNILNLQELWHNNPNQMNNFLDLYDRFIYDNNKLIVSTKIENTDKCLKFSQNCDVFIQEATEILTKMDS